MSEPPRKKPKRTETTKSHRYETFTKRIAKIKIDPVHTVQKARISDDRDDLTKSFFRSALDEWAELNLTTTFTTFCNVASPLTESLPQLLHHADTVVESLLTHIESRHELALEPLLSLVAHLAHDLGQGFIKYFDKTVRVVIHAASSIQDPAAIECCFTCLAWLYKYLSKRLVQDLRPLLGMMIPYMSAKKDYIRRFTAESLAYLVRKTAMNFARNQDPLALALSYVFEQLGDAKNIAENIAYETALMTLLTESMMGVEAKLHSSAADLTKCAIGVTTNLSSKEALSGSIAVLRGTTVALVHQTNAQGFEPVLDVILSTCDDVSAKSSRTQSVAFQLMFAVTGTRKGSRIRQWDRVGKILISRIHSLAQDQDEYATTVSTCATVLQYSPLDQLLPNIASLLEAIELKFDAFEFFTLCASVAEMGRERFQDFLLKPLQQYIIDHWSDNEPGLCYLLQSLHSKGAVTGQVGSTGYLSSSKAWDKHIVSELSILNSQGGLSESTSQYFQLMQAIHIAKESTDLDALRDTLTLASQKALHQKKSNLSLPIRLSLGWAFIRALHLKQTVASSEWKAIGQQPRDAFCMQPFLVASGQIVDQLEEDIVDSVVTSRLIEALLENMLSDSIDLRKQSLEILSTVGQIKSHPWLSTTSRLLIDIIETPYLPSHARHIAMLLRQLPQKQRDLEANSAYEKLVPLFAMGMLRNYHDQTRKDLCTILRTMANDNSIGELIIEVAMKWLQSPLFATPDTQDSSAKNKDDYLSPFECSNLKWIQRAIREQSDNIQDATNLLQRDFDHAHQLHLPRTPSDGRSIALQVLLEMPDIIERRSRNLIPAFLTIFDGKYDLDPEPSDNSASSHTISPDTDRRPWALKDRKMFLELISKFINPKVLYRSSEVYDTLMECLSNGNSEVRKVALTATLNWKDPTLRKYEDILLRVAEEKTATTELATLLNDSDGDASIKHFDRAAVLPVLLRLLFGQLVSRSGSHGSQEAKRKAILRLLFRLDEPEILQFLSIALGRLGKIRLTDEGNFPDHTVPVEIISNDQQYGFLRMMLSMMEVLQSRFSAYGGMIIAPVLYCTARASRQVNQEDHETAPAGALVKNIRRIGLQCLTILFEQSEILDWTPYLTPIFRDLISPRLETFVNDMTQGVSTTLRLISSWASKRHLVSILSDYEPRLLPILWALLSGDAVRAEVKIHIIEQIISPLSEYAQSDSTPDNNAAITLKSQIDGILAAFAVVLGCQPSKDLLVAVTGVIPRLAVHTSTNATFDQALGILIDLLCQPHQKVPPHVKAGLLLATESLLGRSIDTLSVHLKDKLFEVVSGFYNYFRDSPNRVVVGNVLELLSQSNEALLQSVKLCIDLNALSTDRLDQIDFDKRLAAYNKINELKIADSPKLQALPVLQNLIFFSRTAEDFSIRSNSITCLKRYIIDAGQSPNQDIHALIGNVLLPAFKKGARDDSEIVRADFVMLFGLLIKHYQDDSGQLKDMKVLLVGDDDEASFFSNILHIQQHRRTRAIRRLVTEVEKGEITSINIAEFFLPLLEKFANDTSGDESASGTKGHSIAAITDLLKWVDWKVFRKVFRQYRQDLDSATRPEKDSIKLLNNAAECLTSAVKANEDDSTSGSARSYLAQTLPAMPILCNELKQNFVPKLGKFIHHKDEAEISLRIPAAKVAVKLIKMLPTDEVSGLVAPIVLDIAQILRSRAQESRDIARNTLADIVLLLGPSSMDFVLKELRTTLTRGYQLHVLSFTMHTILLVSGDQRKPGDLDYCVDNMVAVIMDDIFGVVGQEKENQDYISSMKEVKSSKSFDSMEILARSTGIKALSKLIQPLQSLLVGSLTAKQLRHIDDLLRRIGVGVSHNDAASSRDLLIFAYELIQAFYREKAAPKAKVLTNDEKNRKRYLVQLDSAQKSVTSTSSSHVYKLARFSLDLVRSTMLKQPQLLTAENVHGFLPVIGDALIQGQEDVKISAFRLLSAVIKLPLKELDGNAVLYTMEAVKVVKSAINTNEEAAQAALKLVTALLRDREHTDIRDTDIAYLLHRTMPDLEEPDRQGVTFNFVKAVMTRQIQLPEVYEIMDRVAIIMVTNQTKNARDAARGVFVHFLLGYPQSEKRWAKQVKFLLKNLDYQYPEGRQSVMEAANGLLLKVDKDMAQELVSALFIPVMLRMANDDHLECREMAGALLSQLFRRSSAAQMQTLLEPLRNWTVQNENVSLVKLSLQAWNLFYGVNPAGAEQELPAVRSCIGRALCADEGEDEETWELQYQALEVFRKLISTYPEVMMTNKQRELWVDVCTLLISRHAWVQNSAASLVGVIFESINTADANGTSLVGAHGLRLDADKVLVVLRNSVKVLKSSKSNEDLARKTIKNLLFLCSWVEANNLTMKIKATTVSDPDVDNADQSDSEGSHDEHSMTTISATQYLFDQLTSLIRREPSVFTAQAFLPRLSALQLLAALFRKIEITSIPETSIIALLMPLTYITNAETQAPRSADPSFSEAYNSYTESAQLLLEALQSKLGDATFVRLMTAASRTMRKRREKRRQKRAIERVVEPEKAARDKRRKVDRTKERRKEIKDIYRKGRRRDLGF